MPTINTQPLKIINYFFAKRKFTLHDAASSASVMENFSRVERPYARMARGLAGERFYKRPQISCKGLSITNHSNSGLRITSDC